MKKVLPIFKKIWFWGIIIGVVLLISTGIYLSNSSHSTATNNFNNNKIMSSSKKIKKSTSSSSTSKAKQSTTQKNEIVASKSSADNPISTSESSSATPASISSNSAIDYVPEKPTTHSSTSSSSSSSSSNQTNDDENSSHAVQHMVSEGYVLVNSTNGRYYSEIKAGLELPSIYIYMTKKEADSKGYHKASVNTDYEIYIPELSEAPTYEERTSQSSSSVQ